MDEKKKDLPITSLAACGTFGGVLPAAASAVDGDCCGAAISVDDFSESAIFLCCSGSFQIFFHKKNKLFFSLLFTKMIIVFCMLLGFYFNNFLISLARTLFQSDGW